MRSWGRIAYKQLVDTTQLTHCSDLWRHSPFHFVLLPTCTFAGTLLGFLLVNYFIFSSHTHDASCSCLAPFSFTAVTLRRHFAHSRHRCTCEDGPRLDCDCLKSPETDKCVPCRFLRGLVFVIAYNMWCKHV